MRLRWVGATIATVALVGVALAQAGAGQPPRPEREGFGFGGRMARWGMAAMLLERADVQRELNLTEQQRNQIRQMREAMRAAREELRNLPPEERRQRMQELRQKYDPVNVLTDAQKKRLRELELQAIGPMAFLNPEVADELKLTQEQRSRLQAIVNEFFSQMRQQFQAGGFGQGQAAQQLQQAREQMEQRMLQVLTPQQRQQWQQMQGKPFQFEGGRPSLWGNWRDREGVPRSGGFTGGRGFGN
ncbi:MAG: Spy/CpxP family protein refolding chaperone [Armatimonadota bacterium]|nr:Spy/CpxP family protein refolding chaperone [Armatimonadota bacterium]